jgi:hypothetical protein
MERSRISDNSALTEKTAPSTDQLWLHPMDFLWDLRRIFDRRFINKKGL